jgi:hypothetical protein
MRIRNKSSWCSLARTRLDEYASSEVAPRDPQDREVELLFWESVRNSDNPSLLQAYMEKYPDGDFKSLAEIRLIELSDSHQMRRPAIIRARS